MSSQRSNLSQAISLKENSSVAKLNENGGVLVKINKRPVNVLDEDTFIKKLDEIIEKDFFPDLEKLRIQKAYHEAVKQNDYDAIRELHSKFNSLIARSSKSNANILATPNIVQIKKKESNKDEASKEVPYANQEPPEDDPRNKISLDQFLATNTSEDNISFETIMTEAAKKEKAKVHQSWLFEKEKQLQIKYKESLMIENGDSKKVPDDVTKSLDTWTYTSKNSLMYIPEGVALTDDELLERSKKTRIINHSNTRFNKELLASSTNNATTSQTNNQLSSHINVISKIGIDGKEAAKETPSVKGYKFVEPSPSPMPGRFAGDESPMMTWGEIESTPFRLDPSATPKLSGGPEFKIPDVPEREKLALSLEEQASAARRKKKDEALKMMQRNLASPSARNSPSLSDKFNSMSPAAQRLLSSKLKSSITTTPSPLSAKSKIQISTPSPFSSKTQMNSPCLTPNSKTSAESIRSSLKRPSDSLTDNLLKLPKNS